MAELRVLKNGRLITGGMDRDGNTPINYHHGNEVVSYLIDYADFLGDATITDVTVSANGLSITEVSSDTQVTLTVTGSSGDFKVMITTSAGLVNVQRIVVRQYFGENGRGY